MNDDALDIIDVFVMLESLADHRFVSLCSRQTQTLVNERAHPLQQPSLLAKVGNSGLVVVREHLVREDGIGDLGSVD